MNRSSANRHQNHRRRAAVICLTVLLAPLALLISGCGGAEVKISAKEFTESIVLGHVLAHLAHDVTIPDAGDPESDGRHVTVDVRPLGGTQTVYAALKKGEIDAYVEYTGTMTEEIFGSDGRPQGDDLVARLKQDGIGMTKPIGFNNTYALAMTKDRATALGIVTYSDLATHPELKFGFSNEFMNRGDGWPPLRAKYSFRNQAMGLDHANAYPALLNGSIDVMDAYATDAKIKEYDLQLLVDDQQFFPVYEAVVLYRLDLAERFPDVVKKFHALAGTIDEGRMAGINYQAEQTNKPSQVAANFVNEQFGIRAEGIDESLAQILMRTTGQHLKLVAISMGIALIIGLPLGIVASRMRRTGQLILGLTGIMQTIPGFALLVIFVPFMGVGPRPAIVALALYSLLPIVRNAYTGLVSVPNDYKESAAALGLPPRQRLWLIEIPMAWRSILAGIKIAVVINVGTATLGAFIGAGGYGEPILTGIRLNRTDLILAGAIPAALMAMIAQAIFEIAERRLVSRGLRLKAAS